jgi:hypothetical protein
MVVFTMNFDHWSMVSPTTNIRVTKIACKLRLLIDTSVFRRDVAALPSVPAAH